MNGLDHQQLPQGRSEGRPGRGDDSRAVQTAGAHPLAHDGDTAETPQYLQCGGIQSDITIMSSLIISYLLTFFKTFSFAHFYCPSISQQGWRH